MIEVKYQRGIELPRQDLWLDPWDAKPFAFVSHAHSDHIAQHAEIITSKGTSLLMQARLPGKRREHVLTFGEPANVRGNAVTLFPAGHIFGSAQLFLEADAGSLLYTGDFKLRPGLSAEPVEWRRAETLIMETTYGLPRYRMPPTEETLSRMVEFCREAHEEDAVPVLFGYSLGKAQEILCALLKADLVPMLHGSVFNLTEIYRALEPDFPDGYVRYAAGEVEGKVLVCPPSANRSRMIMQIKNRRTAVLTGWALDPGTTYRYQVDAAFPLTDHADYPDLLRYVELVQPRRVLTVHGFASAFARDLRVRGIDAWALSEDNQLEFALHRNGDRPRNFEAAPAHPPVQRDPPEEEFDAFSSLGEQISATTSKLKKVALLSEYFRSLDADQLRVAAVYLTGRAFPQSDARTLQVGWAVIKRALLAVSKISEEEFRDIANIHSDAGKTAHEALLGRTSPRPFSLTESRAFFDQLQQARGPLRKGDLVTAQVAALSPLAASYLVRIITGDLRIGLKEGLVEEAVAAAFGASLDEVRDTNMLLGDIGETAFMASRKTLGEATLRLFRPIKCMLASPEATAQAAWMRIAAATAWVEDKYDGIRAQLHVEEDRVEIFTRDLRPVTNQFADLARAARELPHRAIFDGEIIAYDAGRKLTFFDLQKRLGRKTEDDLFLGRNDIPIVYKAFDLLYCDGRSFLKEPLAQRRHALEQIAFPVGLELAPIASVASAEEIETAFKMARRRGNEGLIIKDAASAYTPGRRGIAWIKLKKELATLDVVVVGAETGHGRRAHVLSDYTFAVRDDLSGELLTIGKAYSGLTDDEIEELTEYFKTTTIAQHGRFREVRPDTVLEVAFDSVQPSSRHSSGLALRFPRIKAIRRDKSSREIDTLSFARSLCAEKSAG